MEKINSPLKNPICFVAPGASSVDVRVRTPPSVAWSRLAYGLFQRTVKQNIRLLREVRGELQKNKIASAENESELLVRHFSGLERLDFFTGQFGVSPAARRRIKNAVKERLRGNPLGTVLGEAPFYGRTFFVSKHTLIPRFETEVLVEAVLKILKKEKLHAPEILDVGTGSGILAISLTLERRDCTMTALDSSAKALAVAKKNALFHGVDREIRFLKSDLFEKLGCRFKGHWDFIVSNPPYIAREDFKHLPREVLVEPRLALDGGADGLKVIRRVLDRAPYYLKKGGWIFLEIGSGQADLLRKNGTLAGYKDLRFVRDLNGIERVLAAQNG